jgi:hypothetical protein
MARLTALALTRAAGSRLTWSCRRAVRIAIRCFGAAALLVGACLLIAALSWMLQQRLEAERLALLARRAAAAPVPTARRESVADADAAAVARFIAHLLPHDDIPQAIQDLIALAEERQLLLVRGDYKPQVDNAGGFLRYRMTLPVKGGMAAIQSFVAAALRAHSSLAVESVQFRRERLGSPLVEVRIQWLLLTQLPETVAHQQRQGVTP